MQTKAHQSTALALMLSLLYFSPNAAAEVDRDNIERISVVGQPIKRNSGPTGLDLTIKETPQSVTVLSHDYIKDFELNDLEDIMVQATGISRYKFGAGDNTEFTSRGYLVNALVKDGLPTSIAGPQESRLDTIVYDRVEVLRGAAGLMAGAGQPSATLNVITKQPDRGGFVEVGAEIGSWNKMRTHVDATGALTKDEALAGRVILAYEEKDSFVDKENSNKIVAYTQLHHYFSEDTEASFSVHYQDNELKLSPWGLPIFYSDGSSVEIDKKTNLSSPDSYNGNTHQSYHLKLSHQINLDWALNFGAQYSKTEADITLTYFSGNPNKETGLGLQGGDRRWIETVDGTNFILGLVGRFELFNRSHQVNITYLNADFESTDDRFEELDENARTIFYPLQSINNLHPAAHLTATDKQFIGYWDKATKEQSIALSSKLTLTDDLHAILGVKFFDYERTNERDFAWSGFSSDKGKETGESLYVGLVYNINDQISTYASYTDAYEPQLDKIDVNLKQLAPITARNLEVGIKTTLWDDKLRLNVAYFDSLKEDFGVVIPEYANERPARYRPVDGAEADGFEVELEAKLTEDWQANFGYSDFDVVDENGEDINLYAPRKTLNASTKYTYGAWNLGLSATWDTNRKVDILNVPGVDLGLPTGGRRGAVRAELDSQLLLNAHIKYQYSSQLSVKLNISNLTDETFYDTYGFVPKKYNEPRAYNLSMEYLF
ncbi:TonB-dependent siderophore receptor [Pseudoalteromonas sp. S4498]|uniref:TonB-dependent siderophore receptor n=1 Tax=Pseudoalteromonas galatheae TaxID=579562 RepID=UPI00110A0655|nr:TonB-dependent siderophore receptor [Pseudoalteromonas galatheae]NKC19375.1 TonB-dependent siderophore receptor [Pseudoalteromonas galatheae]